MHTTTRDPDAFYTLGGMGAVREAGWGVWNWMQQLPKHKVNREMLHYFSVELMDIERIRSGIKKVTYYQQNVRELKKQMQRAFDDLEKKGGEAASSGGA